MMPRFFTLSGDLPGVVIAVAIVLACMSVMLLAGELVAHRGKRGIIALSGLIASAALTLAILRPVWVASRTSLVGPRVVVLMDRSRSMLLAGDGSRPRQHDALDALRALGSKERTRLHVMSFGKGAAEPWDPFAPGAEPDAMRSDLLAALHAVSSSDQERPSAIVVVSDGRLDQPGSSQTRESVLQAVGQLRVPVHTVSVATRIPRDASIRSVKAAGAAVAHQPLTLTVEVACQGGLSCPDLPIVVRELVASGSPLLLASGVAHVVDDSASIELPVTLDRAGSRVVEVAVSAPAGDEIPDNDHRLLTFDVTRDRVRILHIAGRPTYDVRALRQWLKSDASLDVVAFFILRTAADEVNAAADDLALIRFPVDELFTEHLASFDAVVLQDFAAVPYGLSPYLSNLAAYVHKGGGLIMVGGLNAFSAGGYARTPIEQVLPAALVAEGPTASIDNTPFVPSITEAGRAAPVLEPLRALLGDELPTMSGTNLLGDPHAGSVVLWAHPVLKTPAGAAMPVLVLGEQGNGRALALSVDDTHKLAFSEMAARTTGRGYGLLWDALLGWLMRDPRYEPARVELSSPCVADSPVRLRLRSVPDLSGPVELTLIPLGRQQSPYPMTVAPTGARSVLDLTLPGQPPGGYSVRVQVGAGPSTQVHFACERGGDEWADSRPDPQRLAAIASATGARAVTWTNAASLSFPAPTQVASERHVAPVLPSWLWSLIAATTLGAHWVARRRRGLV